QLAYYHQIMSLDIIVISTEDIRNEHIPPGAFDFGEKHRDIILLHDDHFRDDELSALLPLVKLNHRNKVTRMYLFGDSKASGNSVLPDYRALGTHEFACQLELPLGQRLINAGHAHVNINTQHRMHPILAEWLNESRYNNSLINSETTYGIPL